MITVTNLSKTFGLKQALKPINMSIQTGEVLGLLGANGAGKTTTMRLLSTVLQPTTGEIVIDGLSLSEYPDKIRQMVGYLPEKPPLYDDLKVGDYLRFVADMRGVDNPASRVSEVLERVGLIGWENTAIKVLSKGYRQRVGLAQALIHEPKILLLDEPNSGLDPSQIVSMRRFLTDLAAERTVIISTHILSEVDKLCTRNIILHEGAIAAQGAISELQSQYGGRFLRLQVRTVSEDWIPQCGQLDFVEQVKLGWSMDGMQQVDVYLPFDAQSSLLRWLEIQHVELVECSWQSKSLEEIFLSIVGAE